MKPNADTCNFQALPANKRSFNNIFCESEAQTQQACQHCAASIGMYTPITPNTTDSRRSILKYGLSGSQVQNPWFPRTNFPSTNQDVLGFYAKYRKHSRGQIPGKDGPAGWTLPERLPQQGEGQCLAEALRMSSGAAPMRAPPQPQRSLAKFSGFFDLLPDPPGSLVTGLKSCAC